MYIKCTRYSHEVRMIRLLARLVAAFRSPQNFFFYSVPCRLVEGSGSLEPKIICSTSPGPDLPTDAIPEHFWLWESPAHEEGTSRISSEPSRSKGSSHTSPEDRELRPPARGAPPRRARGVSSPGGINLADNRDLVPGSSVGNYWFWRPLSVR